MYICIHLFLTLHMTYYEVCRHERVTVPALYFLVQQPEKRYWFDEDMYISISFHMATWPHGQGVAPNDSLTHSVTHSHVACLVGQHLRLRPASNALIGMTSGGVAFNLQVAQVAILFDWRWNPASERLAMDRIHRANSNAFVYLDAGSDDTFVAARRR